MRPGDFYFLLVPPPAGVADFLAQHQWLTVILIVTALTLLGILVRLSNIILNEIKHDTLWEWLEKREQARDSHVMHDENRRLRRLEGEQRRRDLKRQSPSWWDQLRLFR